MLRNRKLCRDIVFCCNKETMSQHRKLCSDIVFFCNIEHYVTIEKTMSRHRKLCYDRNAEKNKKKDENGYFGLFSSPIHPRTINTLFF